MQFTRSAHEGVASGAITLTFRNWKTPKVKVGGCYDVGAVRIEVDDIDFVNFSDVSDADARRAGCANREELRKLASHASDVAADTVLYRVEFHVMGPARGRPVVAASDAAVDHAHGKLDAMDQRSTRGPWTQSYLAVIASHPGVVSTVLADLVDRPRPEFKADVRKLKALGLIESLEVGYQLTELGHKVAQTRSRSGED